MGVLSREVREIRRRRLNREFKVFIFLYCRIRLVILGHGFGNTGSEAFVTCERRGRYGCKDCLQSRLRSLCRKGRRGNVANILRFRLRMSGYASVASISFQFSMWLGCIVGLLSLPANKRFALAHLSCVAYSIVGVRKVVEYIVS